MNKEDLEHLKNIKHTKRRMSILDYLAEHTYEEVPQSKISRVIYFLTVDETLNGTVRAVTSRTLDYLVKTKFVEEVKPRKYRLAAKGRVLVTPIRHTSKRFSMRNKGIRKKVSN